jgi:hypothetical protein
MSLCQGTQCFRLPFTPPSNYVGELPNSHGQTLTGKSYVLHGIRSDLKIAFDLKKECFGLDKLRISVIHKKVGPVLIA